MSQTWSCAEPEPAQFGPGCGKDRSTIIELKTWYIYKSTRNTKPSSDLTSLWWLNLQRNAFKEITFPKHKNERPDQTVRPTMLCLYAFFFIEVSCSFRPRKSWKSPKIDRVMEKTVKTERTAPRTRMHPRPKSNGPGGMTVSLAPIFFLTTCL